MRTMTGWVRGARDHPSAVLLTAQLIGVLVYPFMEGPAGRAALSLFGLIVLVLAVWTLRTTPALTWVSVLLGIPVVILTIFEALDPADQTILLWSSALHAAFYFYTTYGLIRYMFKDRFVTPDELFATGATFTVVAWAFAYLYMACQVVWPGSFIAAIEPDAPRTWFELLFLSFTTPDVDRPLRRRAGGRAGPVDLDDRAGGRAHVRGLRDLEARRPHASPGPRAG